VTAKDAPRGERNMFQAGNTESQKGGFIRQKMARWRKENPDAPLTMAERDRLHREALRERIPEVLDAALEVATDNTHPDFKILAPILIRQDMGNPKQAMEIAGENGGAINLITRIELVPVEPVRENEA
jgi:hypothetical protein